MPKQQITLQTTTTSQRRRRRTRRARRRNALLNAITPMGAMATNIVGGRKRRRARRGQRGILSDLGSLAGNYFLPGIGGSLGGMAGGALESVFGLKNAPAAKSGLTRLTNRNSVIHSAHEKLFDFSIEPDTPAGTMVKNVQLTADNIGRRFRQFSKAWDRYKLRTLIFEVKPNNPSDYAGGWVAAHEPDPGREYVSSTDLPGNLMALSTAVSANIWESGCVASTLDRLPPQGLYVDQGRAADITTTADRRQTSAGQFIVATNTDVPQLSVGSVYVMWEAEFIDPVVETTESVLPSYITVSPGAFQAVVTFESNITCEAVVSYEMFNQRAEPDVKIPGNTVTVDLPNPVTFAYGADQRFLVTQLRFDDQVVTFSGVPTRNAAGAQTLQLPSSFSFPADGLISTQDYLKVKRAQWQAHTLEHRVKVQQDRERSDPTSRMAASIEQLTSRMDRLLSTRSRSG